MAAPTITEALLGEHGVIYQLLAHLTSRPFDSAEEARIQAAELAAGLATHARIEDDLLFVALEVELGPNGGPLAVMREEHAEVEATLERLTQVDDVHEAEALAGHLVRGCPRTLREGGAGALPHGRAAARRRDASQPRRAVGRAAPPRLRLWRRRPPAWWRMQRAETALLPCAP